ncbi:hypothetical protein [Winogradskyella flava]|uniref:hypothetical protein n=1 Tax=Winogradskyella flava TaxID=1884876 RepID=UPI0024909D34|nr:hypothetical protein [Winogradskyella flava]
MRPILFLALVITSLVSCEEQNNSNSVSEPPIVDGFDNEYKSLNTTSLKISDDVTLRVYQNEHFVWLTYNVPEDSYGTMDMVLESPNLTEPINLHVSAQVGEWPANKPELAPQVPESDKWGITKGWTGNPIWLKGLDRSGTEPQLKFKSAPARELQISKSYFGKGVWKFNLEIRAIKDNDGKSQSLIFPKDDAQFELIVD